MSAAQPGTYEANGMPPPSAWRACEAYAEATKEFDKVLAETYRGFEEAVARAYPPPPDPRVADTVTALLAKADALAERLGGIEAAQQLKHAAILAAIENGEDP
jgi:hypothetical protein